MQAVKDEVVKIEWINITRGIAIVLLIMLWGHYFIDCKKNPQDIINNKLLRIEMWIITVLVCLTINKISIAIVL